MTATTSLLVVAYTATSTTPHHVRADDLTRTVCGRPVHYTPVVPPVFVADPCAQCTDQAGTVPAAIHDDPTSRADVEANCPECDEPTPVDGQGRLIAHTVERTKSGHVTCPGSGTTARPAP